VGDMGSLLDDIGRLRRRDVKVLDGVALSEEGVKRATFGRSFLPVIACSARRFTPRPEWRPTVARLVSTRPSIKGH